MSAHINKKIYIILILAFLIRLFFIIKLPYPLVPKLNNESVPGDDAVYEVMGWNLMQRRGFTEDVTEPFKPSINRVPGYPLFIALIYFLFGRNLTSVYVVQALLDVITVFLVYLISLLVFKDIKKALLIGFLVAICPFTILFVRTFFSESTSAFLVTLFVFLFLMAEKKFRMSLYIASGIVFGVITLFRPIYVFFPLVLFLITAIINKFKGIKWSAYFLLLIAMGTVILPWSVRNYYHFKKVILFQTSSGVALMRGTFFPSRTIKQHYEHVSSQYVEDANKFLSLSGNDRIEYEIYMKNMAIEKIEEHPFRFTGYCFIRMPLLWISSYSKLIPPLEVSLKELFRNTIKEILEGDVSKEILFKFTSKLFLSLSNLLYIVTAFYGIFIIFKNWRTFYLIISFILYTTVIYAICGSHDPRYSISVWPLLIIFSGNGLYTLLFHREVNNT